MKKRKAKKNNLKKVKKRLTTYLIIMGIVSTTGLVGYGVWAARNVLYPITTFASETPQPYASADNQISLFTMYTDSENFVKGVRLVQIDTLDKSTKELILPENTRIHLPYGLKEFKLNALYKIAELENKEHPLPLIKQSLINYYGIPADDILIIKSDSDKSFSSYISSPVTLFKLLFDEKWTKENIISTKSRMDLVTIGNNVRLISEANFDNINILDHDIGIVQNDVDGTPAIITDENKLDTYIQKLFQGYSIANEKANISIENATETIGLAAKVSRIITNSGGVVVQINNSESINEQTQIIINNEKWKDSATVNKLHKIIPSGKVVIGEDTHADIIIRLGEDYAHLLNGVEK